VPKVVEARAKRGRAGVPLVVGGIIPAEDKAELERAGVAGVFGPGTTSEELVRFFRERIGKHQDADRRA
jgi:methylmalonyl-CoA mutase C-terminal domain/subunit